MKVKYLIPKNTNKNKESHILIEHWLTIILFDQEHHTVFRIKQLIKHKTENQFEQ